MGLGGIASASFFGMGSAYAAPAGCDTSIGLDPVSGVCQIFGTAYPHPPTAQSGDVLVDTYYSASSIDSANNTITVKWDIRNGISNNLQPGDTVMLVQNQGASVNLTGSGSTLTGTLKSFSTQYGQISTAAAGTYQILQVTSYAPATGLLQLNGTINPNFVISPASATAGVANFQVVRIPNIQGDAILESNLSALRWNSSYGDGGVFGMIVSGQLNMNSKTIDVSGEGFSGGYGYSLRGSGKKLSSVGYPQEALSTPGQLNANGQKGEGIFGTPGFSNNSYYVSGTASSGNMNMGHFSQYTDGYVATGDFGLGALGNAGGGGTDPNASSNDENTGGGGGGNGGPGGNGGYSWATGFDLGGRGGYGISYSSSSPTLNLGGGGGAGTINNVEPSPSTSGSGGASPQATVSGRPANGGSGGSGGGIIFMQLGGIAGPGSIKANGTDGIATTGNDGAGGGGSGGTIMLQTSGICDAITVPQGQGAAAPSVGGGTLSLYAQGGSGGDSWTTQYLLNSNGSPSAGYSAAGQTNVNGNAHGPGGGGGGGEVLTNIASYGPGGTGANGELLASVQGGNAGQTTLGLPNGQNFTEVPPVQVRNYPVGIQRFPSSGPLNLAYGAGDGLVGQVTPIANGPEPSSSTANCAVPVTTTTASTVVSTTTPSTTPVTLPSASPTTTPATTPTTAAGPVAALASSTSSVTVPATHTGEPWNGSTWWILVSLVGFGGAVLAFPKRRKSGASTQM